MIRQFEREGRVVSYLSRGPVGPPGGTLVLLHAFPLSAAMWESQLAAAPPSWRVLAPHLAGFGGSFPHHPGATFQDDARDVLALLDRLHEQRAVVAGLSMGGYIALALARIAAGRLRGLVLADTRADADSDEARRSRIQMLGTLESGGTSAVIEGMLPRLLGETSRRTRPAVVDRVREIAKAQPAFGVREAVRKLMDRADSTTLLPGLACPALVLVGAEDAITGPEIARAMSSSIPGSSLAIIDGAGHLSNLEAPEKFNEALYEFVAKL